MSSLRASWGAARDSRGTVLVFVALSLPAFIGIGGLIVDVGNWFAHKRHLQVQADAGALAAAGKFRHPCVPGGPVSNAILAEAGKYSSVDYTGPGYAPGPGYNAQIGGTPQSNLFRLMNSKTFHEQATPVDPDVVEGDPCTAKMVDVKLTETDLPWYLKLASVDYINAQARVEIRRQTIAKNLIPLGVPNVSPKKVRAFFVDKSKSPGDVGYELASTELVSKGASGALELWSNPTSAPGVPVTVPLAVDASRIGVRVALGDANTPLVGSYAAVCAIDLVSCYDIGSANGLVTIRGFTDEPGSLAAPTVRHAEVLQGSCADPYFNVLSAGCTVRVRSRVGFGAGTSSPGAAKPAGVVVQAKRSDTKTTYDLTYEQDTGTWVGDAAALTTADAGPVSIDLLWGSGCNAQGKNCANSGTFAGVHSTFVANDALSGPVNTVTVTEGLGVSAANSFQTGTTHNLVLTIGLKGSIAIAQAFNDPKVTLKFNQGGLTGFLDCDPALAQVSDEIASGCAPQYTTNSGNACPFNSNPLQCVPIEPGNKVGLLAPGLNLRILGSEKPTTCTAPNNWAQFETAAGLPEGDPRIVQLFVTRMDAFDGNGNGSTPIVDFAAFYITGWQGVGAGKNPCQETGGGDDPANTGEIVGHFIKIIDLANPEGAAEEFCDFSSLSPCVAAFTR